MHTFKTDDGKSWEISIDIPTVKRLATRQEKPISLVDSEQVEALQRNFIATADLIFDLVKDQAESRQITEEQFGRQLSQTFVPARQALFDELLDFFRLCGRQKESAVLSAQLKLEAEEQIGTAKMIAETDLQGTIDQIFAAGKTELQKALNAAISKVGGST